MLHHFYTFPGKSEETGWPSARGECKGRGVQTPQERCAFGGGAHLGQCLTANTVLMCSLAALRVREPMVFSGLRFPLVVFMLGPDLVPVGATELPLMSPVGQQAPCPSLGSGKARRTCFFDFCLDPRGGLVRLWLIIQGSFWARASVGPPELQVGLPPGSCCLFPAEGSLWVLWLLMILATFGLLCW